MLQLVPDIMDHPHHKVIFQLFIVSFTFTEADPPPKINPPLFPSSPRQAPCCSSPMPHPSLWPARRINKMETNSAALFMRPCVPLLLLREQLEEAEEGQHRESSWLPGIYGLVQLSYGETTRLPRAHTHPDVKHLSRHVLCCSRTLTHNHPHATWDNGFYAWYWPTIQHNRRQTLTQMTTTKCCKAGRGRGKWKAWLKAVSHCFCRTPTKQARAKDKWEKQHQWLHLSKNPKDCLVF